MYMPCMSIYVRINLVYCMSYQNPHAAFDVNFVETIKEVFEHELKIIVCLEHNRKCLEEFTVQIGNRPHPSMSACMRPSRMSEK